MPATYELRPIYDLVEYYYIKTRPNVSENLKIAFTNYCGYVVSRGKNAYCDGVKDFTGFTNLLRNSMARMIH